MKGGLGGTAAVGPNRAGAAGKAATFAAVITFGGGDMGFAGRDVVAICKSTNRAGRLARRRT